MVAVVPITRFGMMGLPRRDYGERATSGRDELVMICRKALSLSITLDDGATRLLARIIGRESMMEFEVMTFTIRCIVILVERVFE